MLYECMKCDCKLIVRNLMQTAEINGKFYNCLADCLFCPSCLETYMDSDQIDAYREQIKKIEVEHEGKGSEKAEEVDSPSRD